METKTLQLTEAEANLLQEAIRVAEHEIHVRGQSPFTTIAVSAAMTLDKLHELAARTASLFPQDQRKACRV